MFRNPFSKQSPEQKADGDVELADQTVEESKSTDEELSQGKQRTVYQFNRRAVAAIRGYSELAALGRDFTTNAEAVVFYNETQRRIENVRYNVAQQEALYVKRKKQLTRLVQLLSPQLVSPEDESSTGDEALIDEDVVGDLMSSLSTFEQLCKKDYSVKQKDENDDQKDLRQLKHLIFEQRRVEFTQSILDWLRHKDADTHIEGIYLASDEFQGDDQVSVAVRQIMQELKSDLENKPAEEMKYIIVDRVTKIKDNPRLMQIVFAACGADFSAQENHRSALSTIASNALAAMEGKIRKHKKHADQVIEEFTNNMRVFEHYFHDFFDAYGNDRPHTDAEIQELAYLAGLRGDSSKEFLDLTSNKIIREVVRSGTVEDFEIPLVGAVEGLAVAISHFPPEYLNDNNGRLINMAAKVMTLVGNNATGYSDEQKERLLIAIRSMIEGIANTKSLEQTQKGAKEYGKDVADYLGSQVPTNPLALYSKFQQWIKLSNKKKLASATVTAGEVVESTKKTGGITKDQRKAINNGITALAGLAENQSPLLKYMLACITAELSNIPTEGDPSDLEKLLKTILNAVLVVKSAVLIVASSGALLVQEGIQLIDHLMALIPEQGNEPQDWVKYAKELRALRQYAHNIISSKKNDDEDHDDEEKENEAKSASELSSKLIAYMVELVRKGHVSLHLEYEIFRSMRFALEHCTDNAVKLSAVTMVADILKAEGRNTHDADRAARREQALKFMKDLMTHKDPEIVKAAFMQMVEIKRGYGKAFVSMARRTWGVRNIKPLSLAPYQDGARGGLNTNEAKLSLDDEVKPAASGDHELVSTAKQRRLAVHEQIAELTRQHDRHDRRNLFISVNGHSDPENTHPSEWVNITGAMWDFLESTKSTFILHGDLGSGRRAMVDHLVSQLLRYRKFGEYYPVRIHLKDLVEGGPRDDLLQQGLRSEGWDESVIEIMRRQFSVGASKRKVQTLEERALLPKIIIIVIGLGRHDLPPQSFQRINRHWGRNFKCLLVADAEYPFGISEYAQLVQTTQAKARRQVKQFYIRPLTRQFINVTLSHEEARRKYNQWQKDREKRDKLWLAANRMLELADGSQEDDVPDEYGDNPPKQKVWTKSDYQKVFSENAWLLRLATSPVMLAMLIKMIPKMFDGVSYQQASSRDDILTRFIDELFLEKLQKMRDDPRITITMSEKKLHESYVLFCRKAALQILRENRPLKKHNSAAAIQSSVERRKMEADKFLFDEDNDAIRFGRELAPLEELSDGQYKFIYAEVGVRFAADGLYKEISDSSYAGLTVDNVFNHILLQDSPDVLQALLEYIRIDLTAQAALYAIVMASKTNKLLDTASSNAMTLLVRVVTFSHNTELAGASFSKADLSGGIFDHARLDGCDMSFAKIEKCNFDNASTNKTKMEGVIFREPDTLKTGEKLVGAAFSNDGGIVVTTGEAGSVSCIRNRGRGEKRGEPDLYLPGFRNCISDRCKRTNHLGALAKGWLGVWDIGSGNKVAGPAFIGTEFGKAHGLIFCKDGSRVFAYFTGCVQIFNVSDLNSNGAEKVQPIHQITFEGQHSRFKMSADGRYIAYVLVHEGTLTINVVDINSSDSVYSRDYVFSNLRIDLQWVGDTHALLFHCDDKVIIKDFDSNSDEKVVDDCVNHQIFEDERRLVLLGTNKIEVAEFDDLLSGEENATPNIRAIDFSIDGVFAYLDTSGVLHLHPTQTKNTLPDVKSFHWVQCTGEPTLLCFMNDGRLIYWDPKSNDTRPINLEDGLQIKNCKLSSDKQHAILICENDRRYYVVPMQLDTGEVKNPVRVMINELRLRCIDIVAGKLLIYQNWQWACIFDLEAPDVRRSCKRYRLSTDASVDKRFIAFDAKQNTRGGDLVARSVVFDLVDWKEINVIPQSGATVSRVHDSPLVFSIEHDGNEHFLIIDDDNITLVNHADLPDSMELTQKKDKNKSVSASDGDLLAKQDRGGRVCLMRQDSVNEKQFHQMGTRLHGVTDVVGMQFVTSERTEGDDKELVIACVDGTITYWSFNTSVHEEQSGPSHDVNVRSAVYSDLYEQHITLDVEGKVIAWDSAGQSREIPIPGMISEMTLSVDGSYLYLYSRKESILYRVDVGKLTADQSWKDVEQYIVTKRGSLLFITHKDKQLHADYSAYNSVEEIDSTDGKHKAEDEDKEENPDRKEDEEDDDEEEKARDDEDGEDKVNSKPETETTEREQEVSEADISADILPEPRRVHAIQYLKDANRIVICEEKKSDNEEDVGFCTKVYSDDLLNKDVVTYPSRREYYTSTDGGVAITRDDQSVYYLHIADSNKGSEIDRESVLIPKVDTVSNVMLVNNLLFISYTDDSLGVLDLQNQTFCESTIEGADNYLPSPDGQMLLVLSSLELKFYRVGSTESGQQPTLTLDDRYSDIHEALSCAWLDNRTLATFHTNRAVKIWEITSTHCKQTKVFGQHRFSCVDMQGQGMRLPESLVNKLNEMGADVSTSEEVVHDETQQQIGELAAQVSELRQQNQRLISEMHSLTLYFQARKPDEAEQKDEATNKMVAAGEATTAAANMDGP